MKIEYKRDDIKTLQGGKKEMTIGICDDEIKCVEAAMACCEKVKEEINQKFEYRIFCKGEELLEYEEDIDILFLDVEMNGTNGIDIMKMLEDRDTVKNIIFVSSHSDCVFDSFGIKTRGFICKPIEYDRFAREVKRIVDRQENKKNEVVEILFMGKQIYICVEKIVYLSGEGKYVHVVTEKDEYVICGSLRAWEEKMAKYNFVRVHKSYLVNLKFVSNLKDIVTLISRKEQLPVGRKYKETSRCKYKEYMFKKFRERINDK